MVGPWFSGSSDFIRFPLLKQFSYKNPNRKTVCPTDPTDPTAVNGCDFTIYDVYESLRGSPCGSPGLVTSQRQESLKATLVGLAQLKRCQGRLPLIWGWACEVKISFVCWASDLVNLVNMQASKRVIGCGRMWMMWIIEAILLFQCVRSCCLSPCKSQVLSH